MSSGQIDIYNSEWNISHLLPQEYHVLQMRIYTYYGNYFKKLQCYIKMSLVYENVDIFSSSRNSK